MQAIPKKRLQHISQEFFEMSGRKLMILGIITACMIAWAVVQSHISRRYRSKPNTPVYLIQGLDPTDIGSIILGTGEGAVALKREGGHFVVTNKDNYPAVIKEINALITTCLDIRTTELYTDNPANHKDLGVTEEDAQYVVKFLKPNSDLLAGVIVGKDKEEGRGSFVRMIPGDNVYLTLEHPWIGNQAMNYVDKKLISVTRNDIESVTVSSPDNAYTLQAKKDGDGIVLDNLPTGKKLKDGEVETVLTALTNLMFDDVKDKSAGGKELAFEKKFVCRLKDSTVYTLNIAQKDDKTYIICDTEFTDNTPIIKEKGVESEEELKKKESKLLAADKAKEFSAKHNNWIYEISEYNAKNLVKELLELLEDEEKPQKKGVDE